MNLNMKCLVIGSIFFVSLMSANLFAAAVESEKELCQKFSGDWEFNQMIGRDDEGNEEVLDFDEPAKAFRITGKVDSKTKKCVFTVSSLESKDATAIEFNMDGVTYETSNPSEKEKGTLSTRWVENKTLIGDAEFDSNGKQIELVQETTYVEKNFNMKATSILSVVSDDIVTMETTMKSESNDINTEAHAILKGKKVSKQ